MKNYIKWFKELDKNSIADAGGKGANLGEMWQSDFPIPPGFAVTADAYWDFIHKTKIIKDIEKVLDKLDVDDNDALQKASNDINKIIIAEPMPKDMKEQINKAYKMLSAGGPEKYKMLPEKALDLIKISRDNMFVAVRSSATAEDLPDASFAGQQATYLNMKGDEQVVDAVQRCWGSLFTARAIFYRAKNNFEHMDVKISVIVQKMVDAEVSGVAFSAHPSTGAPEIIIEAAWGLCEMVVAGEVNPDHYVVDKETLKLKSKQVKEQKEMKIRDPMTGKTKKVAVPDRKQKSQVMAEKDIISLAKVIKKIDEHYGKPQDIEWSIENGKIYIVQSRAITTINKEKPTDGAAPSGSGSEIVDKGPKEKILEGMGASPGVGAGEVRIVHDKSELDKVQEGHVLVTKMTDPDMVPAMKRAVAIITDEGGMTCHAAIVSREMGIPCIVGTDEATKKLKDGDEVTVDGTNSIVYKGILEIEEKKDETPTAGGVTMEVPITATKIYMNLGVPDMIDKYVHLPFQGIGLMRVEFIIADDIKAHPNHMIKEGKSQKYIDVLAEKMANAVRKVSPRPVVMRFSDFKTNEYGGLEGGKEYEPEEHNPMIGWRGCSRYTSEDFVEAFRLECRAVKKVRDEMNLKNLWVMIPFVRNTWEVEKALEIMKSEGLERSNEFQVWLMAEVPSMVFMADKFAEMCDGFSIGSNDLTQLVLGVDRDSSKLGKMGYFEERNEAVLRAIAQLIKGAHSKGITISICGQAPSVYPEFTEFLVRHGIDSISVNPDVVIKTRQLVAETERKLLLQNVRKDMGDPGTELRPSTDDSQPDEPPETQTFEPIEEVEHEMPEYRPSIAAPTSSIAPPEPAEDDFPVSEDEEFSALDDDFEEIPPIEGESVDLDFGAPIESEVVDDFTNGPHDEVTVSEDEFSDEIPIPEAKPPQQEDHPPLERGPDPEKVLKYEVEHKTKPMKASDFDYFDFTQFEKPDMPVRKYEEEE